MKRLYILAVLIMISAGLNAQYIYNDFDANQNETFTGWPNIPSLVANPDPSGSNTSANVGEWVRSGEQYAHISCELSGKIDFTTGTSFTLQLYSPVACDVLFKLEDKNNGGVNTEVMQSITQTNTWVELEFDFSGAGSDLYDKIVIFFDFNSFANNTFYFDDVEGPHYEGSQGKLLLANDVQENFEGNGYSTIDEWIFQDPGLDPLPTTTDPVNASNTVGDYNRSGTFQWTNAQAELDHRLDLTNRNQFELDVYLPSGNDYSGDLDNTVAFKLQNSLLGGNAWMTQTEIIQTVDTYDEWVTLTFDFSAVADSVNYDKIIIQFGGEGHWVPGQFYFDNLYLIPWYPTPAYTYNDFDENQNVEFSAWPNDLEIVSNPDPSGINTSAMSAEWQRGTEQYANIYTTLEGPINFDEGTNFQLKIHSPVVCDVLFKIENSNNGGVFLEQTATIWNTNEWVLLNFDFPGGQNGTYDKIVIFPDFGSFNNNTFYIDDIVGPEFDGPKPLLASDVQDNFENNGWGTIDLWIFQDPGMDTLSTTADPVNSSNTVADYNRSGTFQWTNAQTVLEHRLDLSVRNKFELRVYFPSSNDYGLLTPTASMKLQNSLLGGNAWTTQTEIVKNIANYDEWVTLTYDFSAVADSVNYDQIVIQLGGEGHWIPGQFYFDDLWLIPAPYVTVEAPNGGEVITQGDIFNIEWDYGYWEGDIVIELKKGENTPVPIVTGLPVSDTLYEWNVPADEPVGDDYKIIITSMEEDFPTDTSDNYFTIQSNEVMANFSASPTSLIPGDSTMFTDESTGNIITWDWTFEGGTPDYYYGQEPTYIVYNETGLFDVTLVVSDGTISDTLTIEDYIMVSEIPVADFTANFTNILAGQTVDFTSNSSGANLEFEWYFEGGTPETSTDENPAGILYSEVGTFDVKLIVTNTFGSDTLLKEDYITANPVGIYENSTRVFSIWPNPANDIINVAIHINSNYQINISDLRGKLLYSGKNTGKINNINIGNIESGIYIVTLINLDKNISKSQKLILK